MPRSWHPFDEALAIERWRPLFPDVAPDNLHTFVTDQQDARRTLVRDGRFDSVLDELARDASELVQLQDEVIRRARLAS